jgi:hypothetical protein
MSFPKYQKGDLVTCSESEEIEQPMIIEGRNLWFDGQTIVYYVKGKHKKKGNELTVSLTENILKPYNQ